ncbi:MAG TPA: DMT family transporter [Chloroflexota bacterium]|nr:DMT family transporter [Chloroflexota bacterium]
MTTRPLSYLTTPFPRVALFTLLLGASAIGFAPILVRLSDAGPISTAFWRLALALPVLWLGVWWARRRETSLMQPETASGAPLSRRDIAFLAAAGFFFAGDLILWHLAIKYTSVANATLLPNMAPVFVTIGAWFFFRQRVTRLFLLGLLLAMGGAALLIGESFSLSADHLLGDLLALGTAVFYASYLLATKHLRQNMTALTFMAWSGTFCALLLLPAALLSGEPFWPGTAALSAAEVAVGWLVLLTMGVVVHAGGQGLIAHAMAALPATFSAVSLLWQPVMAAIFAWLLLSERLSPVQMLGGLVVLSGILVARRGSTK